MAYSNILHRNLQEIKKNRCFLIRTKQEHCSKNTYIDLVLFQSFVFIMVGMNFGFAVKRIMC